VLAHQGDPALAAPFHSFVQDGAACHASHRDAPEVSLHKISR
jgi:hypothetical protein